MQRFTVKYEITTYAGESINEKLNWICLEQSAELPEEVVNPDILKRVKGEVVEVEGLSQSKYSAKISWPVDNAGNDITNFLNILYGNISLKRGIKVLSVSWDDVSEIFKGAMFGIEGIRQRFDIHERSMACGVLKPMGLSVTELGNLAREFALGGIDLIKDDHGLANQSYAPFRERVEKVIAAISSTADNTGKRTRYFPNITVSGSKIMDNYRFAADSGADGVMLIPELCGFEMMHELAQSNIELPIIAHPAFTGTMVTDPDHGFTPAFLYGELFRVLGADFTVYPNTGGRFSFSENECLSLNESARKPMKSFKPIFPTPGGGMKRETISEWSAKYGPDTVFLLGASIFQHPLGVQEAVREVQEGLSNT